MLSNLRRFTQLENEQSWLEQLGFYVCCVFIFTSHFQMVVYLIWPFFLICICILSIFFILVMVLLSSWHFLYWQGSHVINSHLFEFLNEEVLFQRVMLALFSMTHFLCWYLWYFKLARSTIEYYWVLELLWTHPKGDNLKIL